MDKETQIKAIGLVLDNPANILTTTSRDLLETLRTSIEADIEPQEDSSELIDIDVLNEGIETQWGVITMQSAMIDTDGTNLEDGLEIKLDGELIGEALGYTSSIEFETINELEKFVEKHCDF